MCTFVNERNTGTIKIVKQASGGTDTEFVFDVTGVTPFTKTILAGDDTPMDMTQMTVLSSPGYSIAEQAVTGWMLMDGYPMCTGNMQGAVNPDDFEVLKNETILCTFVNERNTGTIKIVKQASGDDDTEFVFDVDGATPFTKTILAGDDTPMDMTQMTVLSSPGYSIAEQAVHIG